MTGRAVLETAEEMREKMKSIAASLMDCSPEQVKLEKGRFSTGNGTRRAISFSEVAGHAAQQGHDAPALEAFMVGPLPFVLKSGAVG